MIVMTGDEKADQIRAKLNSKRFVPVHMLDLHVPEVVKESDKRRIYTDMANFINQYTNTVRRGNYLVKARSTNWTTVNHMIY